MRTKGKVFEIGVMKTGTTSLGAALNILGYKVCDWEPKLAAEFAKTGDFNALTQHINKYDAFNDGPWHDCDFRDLDRTYPGSKFIVLERDDDRWIESMERHLSPAYNVNKIKRHYLQHQWIDDRERYIQELISWKNGKYEEIKRYFACRPADLLSFKINDGWEPLCKFLGKPIPNKSFPEKNVSHGNAIRQVFRKIRLPHI